MKKILFVAAILFLTACGMVDVAPSGFGVVSTQEDEPEIDENVDYYVLHEPTENLMHLQQQDNTLRLSMRQPITLNPLLNEDVTVARILRLIFEPIIVLDENFRPTAHLAEVELSSDFAGAVLTIRADAFWSDGIPVTSDDLIFSIDTLRQASAAAIYRQNVANIAEVTRINSRTVQIDFVQGSAYAVNMLNFPIIPQHHYAGALQATAMSPLGNGTYVFDSLTPMRSMTLIESPNTFRTRPQISEIEVLFLPNTQTELYAFDQGRIDAIHLPLTEWVRHHSVRHINYEIFPAMYFEFIGFSFERAIFQNIDVRRGVAYAFNANAAVNAVYLTHAVRAASPIHPNNWAEGNVQSLAHSPEQARELLNRINMPLTILANADNPQRVAIAGRLAADLTAVGLQAHVETVPYAEYFARIESGDFDLFIGGVNLGFTPDVQFLFQGGLFTTDTELETALTLTRLAFSESAYTQAITNFGQLFSERLPVISLAFRHSAIITNARVQQNNPPTPDNVFGWINEWVIER